MSLDISFNRAAAIAAGIELRSEQRGSDDQIEGARRDPEFDPSYLRYLEGVAEYVRVPAMLYQDGGETLPFWVENNGVGGRIFVRANRWGDTYAPLTVWLTEHNIQWEES